MITANSLFIKRLSAEWRNNLSALKLIADWTVIVYIIIPFVCLGIYQYVLWWRTPPEGLALIPFDFFVLIINSGISQVGFSKNFSGIRFYIRKE